MSMSESITKWITVLAVSTMKQNTIIKLMKVKNQFFTKQKLNCLIWLFQINIFIKLWKYSVQYFFFNITMGGGDTDYPVDPQDS